MTDARNAYSYVLELANVDPETGKPAESWYHPPANGTPAALVPATEAAQAPPPATTTAVVPATTAPAPVATPRQQSQPPVAVPAPVQQQQLRQPPQPQYVPETKYRTHPCVAASIVILFLLVLGIGAYLALKQFNIL